MQLIAEDGGGAGRGGGAAGRGRGADRGVAGRGLALPGARPPAGGPAAAPHPQPQADHRLQVSVWTLALETIRET